MDKHSAVNWDTSNSAKLCQSVAKANAVKYGCTLRCEIARLAAHGFLHLLGYDHGRKMFDLQDKILKEVNYA